MADEEDIDYSEPFDAIATTEAISFAISAINDVSKNNVYAK